MRKKYAAILGIFLRVLGQVLVAFFRVDFLPPMAEWYSGLIPSCPIAHSQSNRIFCAPDHELFLPEGLFELSSILAPPLLVELFGQDFVNDQLVFLFNCFRDEWH